MNLGANLSFSKFVSHQLLISCAVTVALLTPVAIAGSAKTGKLTALEGFVEQTPKFDTHLPDYHFQLGVDQTVLRGSERKNLLHAKAKLKNLRARADLFYLKTTTNDTLLKAQTAKSAYPLQAKIDKNGAPLQGKVTEVPRSPLNTFERDVHAPFHLDLDKLMSKVAPNLVSAMDLEIGQAPVRTAESVARSVRELEPQLLARLPRAAMPAVPAPVKVDASLTHALDTETKHSSSSMHDTTADGAAKLKKEMEQSDRMRGDGEKLTGLGAANIPKMPQMPFGPSTTSSSKNSASDQAAREMEAQMARVKKQTSSAADIDAELNDAKNQSRTKLAFSQPGMDAILTHARSLPPQKNLPDLPNAAVQLDVDDIIPWDKWHARFAQLAHDPIFKSVSGIKNPSGANTVQITVSSNHTLTVKLVKASNIIFDNAIISAYKSLNGNSNLAFPRLSRRQSITFLVDNEHKGTGVPTGVQSQPSVGDKEVIRHQI